MCDAVDYRYCNNTCRISRYGPLLFEWWILYFLPSSVVQCTVSAVHIALPAGRTSQEKTGSCDLFVDRFGFGLLLILWREIKRRLKMMSCLRKLALLFFNNNEVFGTRALELRTPVTRESISVTMCFYHPWGGMWDCFTLNGDVSIIN